MKALVLSGGTIRGAFQAGAINALLKSGFTPDYIFGVSVGSLNGAFLSDRAGRAIRNNEEVNWESIGEELKQFWLQKIQKPSSIIRKRSSWEVGWRAITGRFKGLVDTNPLRNLLFSTVNYENMLSSPVSFSVGCVNLTDGEFSNIDARSPDFMEYIFASSSIPIIMPANLINNAPIADGGLRNIAPLKHAIHAGATEIVLIACQAEKMQAKEFYSKNLFSLVNRVQDILLDEIVQNDIDHCKGANRFLSRGGGPSEEGINSGKKRIKISVIRPLTNPDVNLLQFNQNDIKALIHAGEITPSAEIT